MTKYKLHMTLKDGQNLGYIKVRDNEPYYGYGLVEGTEFSKSEVLELLNKISNKTYNIYSEVTLHTESGRSIRTKLCNNLLRQYLLGV